MDTTEERVKRVVNDVLGIPADEIQSDKGFVEDLGADSLDRVEIIMGIEDEFGVEISDEDAEPMHKVGDVIAYLDKHLRAL